MTARASLGLLAAAVALILMELSACAPVHRPVELSVAAPPNRRIPLRAALVLSESFSRELSPTKSPTPSRAVYDTDKAILEGVKRTVTLAFSSVEIASSKDAAFRSGTIDAVLMPEVVVWDNNFDRPLLKMRWTVLDRGDHIVWQETITTQSSWAQLRERHAMPSPGFSTEAATRVLTSNLRDTIEAQLNELLIRLYAYPWWERLVTEKRTK